MKQIRTVGIIRRSWIAVLMLSVAACVCSGGGGSVLPIGGSVEPTSLDQYGISRENAVVWEAGEPDTLDPATWLFGAEGVVADLYSGLVRLGADMTVVPDLAEDWEISADGTVYTFHLRQNATYHSGRSFTAADVAYSWERALSPEVNSYTAPNFLGDIVGSAAVMAGEETSLAGLRIIDDYTLEVTLDAPKPYFLFKLTAPSAWIVDQETIDQIETDPIGTGPFRLMRHDEDEVFIMQRFEDYHLGPASLEYVVYRINAGYGIRLYETGDIDLAYITEDLVERAQNPNDPLYGNVQAVNGLFTDYLQFDMTQPPFDDPLVRRAFIMAIDRDEYNEVILEGEGVLAQGLYPPGLPGFNADVAGIAYDPEGAVQALRDSQYGGAEGLPPITLTTIGSAGNISASEGLLIQMWNDVLGVTVTPEGLDFESYYDAVYSGNHGQIISAGWAADYPDPETFAALFATGSVENRGNYSNLDYDALLAEARIEADPATRIRMYQELEQMLVDDAAGIFLSHSQAYYVVTKPYLQGYLSTHIGVPQNMYLSIVPTE